MVTPSLSFIIVTYNRQAELERCIMSCLSQQKLPSEFEMIIIDNGRSLVLSSEISRAAQSRRVALTILSVDNLGVAGGRNLGMRHARGSYWVFIDDDAVWSSSDDVATLLANLQVHSTCAAVAVKVLEEGTRELITWLLPHPDKQFLATQQLPVEVPYYYGGGHALRADAVRSVGGYPERYFYSMEEVDLSIRLIDAGYHILFDPRVAIVHPYMPSIRGDNYWITNAANKIQMGWRLFPMPYPLTIAIIWSAYTLLKTKRLKALVNLWERIWHCRSELARERHPINGKTTLYLRRIGARLQY